jgi:hypothetical protein
MGDRSLASSSYAVSTEEGIHKSMSQAEIRITIAKLSSRKTARPLCPAKNRLTKLRDTDEFGAIPKLVLFFFFGDDGSYHFKFTYIQMYCCKANRVTYFFT